MKEFQWLGSSWTCKRRRKHYQAFYRNGVGISVNEFVFVLAEEDKRLIAYIDDMYENAKGRKMVVVRWFHKFDEVGTDFACDFYDREIFFSLCLQDLSIECIDGLATVLSPQHYSKFLKEMKHSPLEPFVCHRQYENDDLKPFDVTQVKGYWKQEIVRYMFARSSSETSEMWCLSYGLQKKLDIGGVPAVKSRKRLRLSRDTRIDLQCSNMNNTVDGDDILGLSNIRCSDQKRNDVVKAGLEQSPVPTASPKDVTVGASQCTSVGSLVEVLSHDSGMRGCWFRAVVIKKGRNKVKLRYHDIKDADNEAISLEEWVVASRIAVRDEMGIRIYGRTTIRPVFLQHYVKTLPVINVGSAVDVWWHDGWWEGIVIQKQSDDKFRVYFPGEKREAVFNQSDLRHSQEWLGCTWKELNERPALAASILSNLVKDEELAKGVKQPQLKVCTDKHFDHHTGIKDTCPRVDPDCVCNQQPEPKSKKANNSSVPDLSKDQSLLQLKWSSSHKRRRNSSCVKKLHPCSTDGMNSGRRKSHEDNQDFLIPSTMKIEKESCKSTNVVDRDNYKYISDSLFGSSVVPALTNLVMSR